MAFIEGFTVKSWKDFRKGIEDAYDFHTTPQGVELIASSDGITRDPKGVPVLPDWENPFHLLDMIRFFRNYDGTPSRKAAELFDRTFIRAGEHGIKKAFEEASKEIDIYGRRWLWEQGQRDFDYLVYDFPGCVGVGVVIKDGVVKYGYIADCGLAVFSHDGKVVFRTKNEGPNSKGSIDEDIRKKYKTKLRYPDFRHPEGRKIIRSLYRNNPSNGLAYGALTGEKEAMHYVRTGEFKLEDNILAVYTDGLEHAVHSPEFARMIKEKRQTWLIHKLCQKKVRTEGTLVLRR